MVRSLFGKLLEEFGSFSPVVATASHQLLQRCRHVVRLWRKMLLSLRQTLLQSCPTAVTMDVLGACLLPAARCIIAQYSKLQPSEAWQARLAADVWHITETCLAITQPIEAVGRCGCTVVSICRNVF